MVEQSTHTLKIEGLNPTTSTEREKMMLLESSVSDDTIWSITLELSFTVIEASFTLTYDVKSTGITYDDHQLMIIVCLLYRQLNINFHARKSSVTLAPAEAIFLVLCNPSVNEL